MPLCLRVFRLGEQIGLGHHAQDVCLGVDNRNTADLVLGEDLRDLLVGRIAFDGDDIPRHDILHTTVLHRSLDSWLRTIAMDVLACRSTTWLTDPRTISAKRPRPCEPTTRSTAPIASSIRARAG